MTAELHQGPLRGLRVIDLATVFAGPSAARRLADFGADVIKVERVGDGDGARNLGERDGADGYYWRHVGRNKRPIELDLKSDGGKDVLMRLVRSADVLIENFRPGTMERLGLDPEAMSTLAYTTGQADGPPTLPPVALADEITGALSAFSVLAAIRHRDLTGEGQVIDATLLESMLDVVGPGPAITNRTGVSDQRIGSRLWFSAPRNVYQCSDGWICMSGSADSVAKRILGVVGGDDLINDPRFATNAGRIDHVEALDALITAWTLRHTWADAVQILADAGAAAGPVYSAEQLIRDEHVIGRGSLAPVENPHGDGELLQPAVTPRLSRTPGAIRHAGLAKGSCTEDVLAELGYSECEIAAMSESGAIGALPVSA